MTITKQLTTNEKFNIIQKLNESFVLVQKLNDILLERKLPLITIEYKETATKIQLIVQIPSLFIRSLEDSLSVTMGLIDDTKSIDHTFITLEAWYNKKIILNNFAFLNYQLTKLLDFLMLQLGKYLFSIPSVESNQETDADDKGVQDLNILF